MVLNRLSELHDERFLFYKVLEIWLKKYTRMHTFDVRSSGFKPEKKQFLKILKYYLKIFD